MRWSDRTGSSINLFTDKGKGKPRPRVLVSPKSSILSCKLATRLASRAQASARLCVFLLEMVDESLNSCNFSSFLILERRADSQLLIILFRLCSISWRRFKSSSLLLLFGIITTESGLRPRVFLFPPTPTITRNSFYICTYVYRKYIYRNWN